MLRDLGNTPTGVSGYQMGLIYMKQAKIYKPYHLYMEPVERCGTLWTGSFPRGYRVRERNEEQLVETQQHHAETDFSKAPQTNKCLL